MFIMNSLLNVSQLIFELGGTGKVADELNLRPSTISNWKKNNKIPNIHKNRIEILKKKSSKFLSQDKSHKIFKFNSLKKILLIISGGVACYKSLELIRLFKKNNIKLDIILTDSAQKFITPLLVTSLSGTKCYTNLFSEEDEQKMNHINLARNNDLVLVAPATANLIAKFSHGICDDLASTVLLATNKKILISPSMNPFMWNNPATIKNVNILKSRNVEFIEPEKGNMACGEEGYGRLPEVGSIFRLVVKKLDDSIDLVRDYNIKKLNVLITAGPTQENIDAVRFLSNRSSGKQGFAIANEFMKAGARVTLISGPTEIEKPNVDKIIEVQTAEEMLKAVLKESSTDIFISVAAVADWKMNYSVKKDLKYKKLKKNNIKYINSSIQLVENKDIIKTLSNIENKPKVLVGFAAETENLIKNAKNKLKSKKLDLIIANKITKNNYPFNNDKNKISIINDKEIKRYKELDKTEIAKLIVKETILSFCRK